MEAFVTDMHIEETKIPLGAAKVDLIKGKQLAEETLRRIGKRDYRIFKADSAWFTTA